MRLHKRDSSFPDKACSKCSLPVQENKEALKRPLILLPLAYICPQCDLFHCNAQDVSKFIKEKKNIRR
jgi:hypothetical protein